MSPAPKLPPREGAPSGQADTPLPRQESADEEDVEEEEESGAPKDTQKTLGKGQGAQQLEGKDVVGLEYLGGGEEWIVESLALRLWGLVFWALVHCLLFLTFHFDTSSGKMINA